MPLKSSFPRAFWLALNVQLSVPVHCRSPLKCVQIIRKVIRLAQTYLKPRNQQKLISRVFHFTKNKQQLGKETEVQIVFRLFDSFLVSDFC